MNRSTATFTALIAFLAADVLPAAETEWPQFRGPTGQGISAASHVPTVWSGESNVAWKAELPGKGWSSPVLSHGKLYLTDAETKDGETTLHALCIDAATGATDWNREVFHPEAASVAAMHTKNSPASATPIVAGDRLYVHFGHMGTAALDLSGNVLWRQNSLKYTPVHGNGGSPILLDGALIFGCDGLDNPFLVSLNTSDGSVNWQTARNSPAHKHFSFCTALAIQVDGHTQVISPCSGFVGGYDPADGREIWRVDYGEGYSVVPRPVYSHDLLFISSGFDSPVLYAIKPQGASGDCTSTQVAWTQRKGAPCTPSVLAVGDELYMVSDNGIASCSDAATGREYWRQRLEGGFSASPLFAEGNIYFQNEAGVGFVIKAGKTYELISRNDLGERTLASYAVEDGALYIRSEQHLFRIKY